MKTLVLGAALVAAGFGAYMLLRKPAEQKNDASSFGGSGGSVGGGFVESPSGATPYNYTYNVDLGGSSSPFPTGSQSEPQLTPALSTGGSSRRSSSPSSSVYGIASSARGTILSDGSTVPASFAPAPLNYTPAPRTLNYTPVPSTKKSPFASYA